MEWFYDQLSVKVASTFKVIGWVSQRDTNILARDQKTVGREDVVVWAGAWSGHDAGNEESGEEVGETHCELWTLMDDEN